MQRSRLNLKALSYTNATTADSGGHILSRREMLGVSGTSAIAVSPAMRALGATLRQQVEIIEGRNRVAFKLAGKERWVVDTSQFTGSPVIRLQRSETSIRLELRGARYPGTKLPGDFVARLTNGITGWRMHLHMALGNFSTEVPFERWLMGDVVARGRLSLSDHSISLASDTEVTMRGRAKAEFHPDWRMSLRGHSLAGIRLAGTSLKSDEVTLALLPPTAISILSRPPARRTSIELMRGSYRWSVPVMHHAGAGWDLTSDGSSFDHMTVELGETRAGSLRAGLLAESISPTAALFFQPHARIGENGTEPFQLPLIHPRYAVAFHSGSQEAALTATYGDPVWLNVTGCSFQVGGHADAEPFMLRLSQGKETLHCTPSLFTMVTALAGAVVQPAVAGTGERLAFVTDSRDTAYVQHPANRVRVHLDGKHRLKPLIAVTSPEVSVIRPQDLLVLTFFFQNIDLNTSSGVAPTLTVHDSTRPGFLGVRFPAQHVVEQSFTESSPSPYPSSSVTQPAINAFISQPSRLVFRVPANTPAIPFTLQSLLSWNQWALNTTGVAVAPDSTPSWSQFTDFPYFKPPVEPGSMETAVGLPYRLLLSPPNQLDNTPTPDLPAFSHNTGEVTHDGRTELWHTRYAAKSHVDGSIQEVPGDSRLTLRAVWSPDFPKPAVSNLDDPAIGVDTPYDVPGSAAGTNRSYLVGLMSDFSNYDPTRLAIGPQFLPSPVLANRLMLSALGAWADVQGSWADPKIPLIEWRNRTTMGRDHYVKIVLRGYLFPFGHQAAQVTVTEREVVQFTGTPGTFAYLIKRSFILILQHEKTYRPEDFPAGWDDPHTHARKMPFKRIRITTEVTPPMSQTNVPVGTQPNDTAYWVDVGGSHFPFHVVAEDMEGKTIEFGAPAIFIQDVHGVPTDATSMSTVADAYTKDAGSTYGLAGQTVLLSEKSPLTSLAKDQNLEGISIKIDGEVPPNTVGLPAMQARFYPAMNHATVHLPAVKQLVGLASDTDIKLNDTYLQHGLDPSQNTGQVYADLLSTLPLKYGGSGQAPVTPGVITPNLAISALSATAGPIGGNPSTFVGGEFNPSDFFGGLLGKDSPSILGGIKLSDILALATGVSDPAALAGMVPNLVRQQLPNEIDTTLTWTSNVRPDPTQTFVPDGGTQLTIVGVSKVFLNGAAPSFELNGSLGPFTLNLITGVPVVKVKFNSFSFHIKDGQKMEVKPSLGQVTFLPPLDFIQTLESYLSSVLGGGVYVDIQPTYVTAGFNLPIPSIATGFFDLMNISLGAGISIPFTGDPVRLRFNFSTKEHPFVVAVTFLGGGGYVSLAVGADGIESLDAALEVGGILAVDLVIVAAEIHAMLGIYLHWEKTDLSLTGYVRFGGEVSVMGLISVGIDFLIGVKYDFTTHDLYGRGELSIEVSIAFFSKTFSATIEKRIPGPSSVAATARTRTALGAGDRLTPQSELRLPAKAVAPPTLSATLTQAEWTVYCNAFA